MRNPPSPLIIVQSLNRSETCCLVTAFVGDNIMRGIVLLIDMPRSSRQVSATVHSPCLSSLSKHPHFSFEARTQVVILYMARSRATNQSMNESGGAGVSFMHM
jgi:hypothetical protein